MSSPGNVVPGNDWRGILGEAAIEVFSMMVGVQITAPQNGLHPVFANVTGTVGIAGAISAILSLRCSTKSAINIASAMLGIPAEDAAPQQCDAIGEICNMVAGHFKQKVGLGDKCMLSLPTVITGTKYQLHSPPDFERLELPLLYQEEPIWLALEVRR